MATDSSLVATGDESSRQYGDGEVQARKALALAVLGRQSDAERSLIELKDRFASGQHPRVSIRVLTLEGVFSYYKDRGISSIDRVRRANALARAAGYVDLIAETAAWVSHLAFNFEKFDLLAQGLSEALKCFEAADEVHKSRTCLVIADARQFLGESRVASKWYVNARQFARRGKSREMMASIEYNRIIMLLSRARVNRYLPEIRQLDFKLNWEVEISSLKNLHQGLEATSLKDLLLLCECYASQELLDFPRALQLLGEIRDRGSAELCGLSQQLLDLEISWTRSRCAGLTDLSQHATLDLDGLEEWPLNDQAIGLFLLRDIYLQSGKTWDTDRFEAMRQAVISHCRATDDMLLAAISSSDSYLEAITASALRAQ